MKFMKTLDLWKEKISKLLLSFSIPCIISMLVGALYNIVDQIFIGNGVGYLGNAATNIVYPFTVIALSFSIITTGLNGIIRADGSPKFAMFAALIKYSFRSCCYFYFQPRS